MIEAICVYCGSSYGKNSKFTDTAIELGKVLAQNNITLVYGGSSIGLMGAIANSVLKNNGKVVGIIPETFAEKVRHKNLTQLILVKNMHQRKQRMSDLADAFIAMPGGLGTLEEVFETLTWAQLGLHKKPIGLLNIDNYYDKLNDFLDYCVKQGFIKREHKQMLMLSENPWELLMKFGSYTAPCIPKI